MPRLRRSWEPCIYHWAEDAEDFLREYLAEAGRAILLVAGAGFDPRSILLASLLPEAICKSAQAILIREERPNPAQELVKRAERHRDTLRAAFPKAQERAVPIFARDNAIIGGREGVRLMNGQSLEGITDIIIDMSALSIGVAFPIIKHFIERLRGEARAAPHFI